MTTPIKSRRLGMFHINPDFIDCHPAEVMELMSRVIVLKAEYSIMWDAYEYIAVCDDFEEMTVPGIAKEYFPLFKMHDDRTVTFEGWQ